MSKEPIELKRAVDSYKRASRVSVGEIAMRTAVAAIPYAGNSVLELWDGLAQRRTQERLNTVFDEMKEQLSASVSLRGEVLEVHHSARSGFVGAQVWTGFPITRMVLHPRVAPHQDRVHEWLCILTPNQPRSSVNSGGRTIWEGIP